MKQRSRSRRPPRRPKPSPARPLVPVAGGPDSLLPGQSSLAPSPLLPKKVGSPEVTPIPTAPVEAPAPVEATGEVAPAEAVAVPEVGGAPAEAPVEVQLIIPPPPADMESRARGGARRAGNNMDSAGTANQDLPTADSSAGAARANVEEPVTETAARAQSGLTAALRERPAPSPEIEELCADIQDAIENRRPVDEASLRRADPEAEAQAVGDRLNGDITEDTEGIQGEYDQVNEPPAGEATQISAPIPETPQTVATPNINATAANPAAVPDGDLSLDADLAASQGQVEEAGMQTDPANLITTGPVAEARSGLGELSTAAAESPAIVIQQQAEAIANSRSAMRNTESDALAALERSRASTIEDAAGQQIAMVGSEVQQREAASSAAQTIFTQAQTDVNDLLRPLVPTAMERWNTGKERIAGEFDRELQRAKDLVDERHEGIGGAFVSIWDDVTGLPSSITRIYDSAERTFGRDICTLIREVSTYVNGVVIACEEIIDNADTRIAGIFDSLPEELQGWATTQQEGFQGQLNGLRDNVHTTQEDFTQDLVNQAGDAVQEARERIDALREAAKGLIQKVADAVDAFLEDPVKAIIDGLLMIVGIAPGAFWALIARIEQVASDIADDPMNFANNLMLGIGQGFQRFFDNFFSNLLGGFINWLFSAMGTVGVEIPADTSLKSIITFMLQLMGITWPRIREILVRHIGAENVELLEQAYEILNLLIEQGPGGIFEMIKEQLDPQTILNTIIESAVSFMVEKIVAVATVRIIGLFNPVGAIAQAVEAIYKVLKWIFQNAARIFQLVETVVNGMADIIAGNIAGMADKTEQALKGMLVPVIDFIAGFLSLGDLPEKIAEVVGGFQEMVLAGIDRVVGFLVAQARSVLAALGLGGNPDGEDGGDGLADDEVGERISFSADGESHRLYFAGDDGTRLMVASTPETMETKLRRWTSSVNDLNADNRNEARRLLGEARTQMGITLEEGEQSALAINAAEADPTDPAKVQAAQQEDNQTEAAQRELIPTLTRLFELFGEKSAIVEYARELGQMDSTSENDALNEVSSHDPDYIALGNWAGVKTRLKTASSISTLHDQPLGTTNNQMNFQTRNYGSIFRPGLDAAIPIELAKAKNANKTEERLLRKISREQYALNRRPVVHGSSSYPPAEETSRAMAQALKNSLQNLLFNGGSAGSLVSAAQSYFEKSLEGYNTHSEYQPQIRSIKIENGALIVNYDYNAESENNAGPQDFTSTIQLSSIAGNVVDQFTEGSNLVLGFVEGRGHTDSAGSHGSTVDTGEVQLNAAHLLADQFMGSGYKAALNLVLTSDTYNQNTMATAERAIRAQVQRHQNANPDQQVSFTLQVTARWKAVNDDPALAALRPVLASSASNLTPDDLQKLADTTYQTLITRQEPRVVQSVAYRGIILLGPTSIDFIRQDIGADTTLEAEIF